MTQEERERLGKRAYAHARENWAPEQMEAKVARLYLSVIDGAREQRKRSGLDRK